MDAPRKSSMSIQQPLSHYCETLFQTALVEIKQRVDGRVPDCFISYSCGYEKKLMTFEEKQQRKLITRLVADLSRTGITPDYDLDNLPIGYNIDTFLDKIFQTKCVILLFSKRFKQQCEENLNSGAAKELKRILKRKENLRGDCSFLIHNDAFLESITTCSKLMI